MFLDWEDKYSVGILEIDKQHQRLFDLINELNDAMAQRKGTEILVKVFSGLLEYTSIHFKTEETLMRMNEYDDLDRHHSEHAKLVEQALELKAKFDSGELMVTLSVMQFLKDWVSNHILVNDQKYAPYLKSRGVS